VSRFNGRHLDQSRLGQPRDYIRCTDQFGVDREAEFWLPADGDRVSMLVAVEQHHLVCDWMTIRRPSTAAVLARRFGTSPATISAVVTGRRWIGETLFAALVAEIRHHHARNPTT
jgi:hypothetical protein